MRYNAKENNSFKNLIKTFPLIINQFFDISKFCVINTKKIKPVVKYRHKGSVIQFRNYLSFNVMPDEKIVFCFKFNEFDPSENYVVMAKKINLDTPNQCHLENGEIGTFKEFFTTKIPMVEAVNFLKDLIDDIMSETIKIENVSEKLNIFFSKFNNETINKNDLKTDFMKNNLFLDIADVKKITSSKIDGKLKNGLRRITPAEELETKKKIRKEINEDLRNKELNSLYQQMEEKEKEIKVLKSQYAKLKNMIEKSAVEKYQSSFDKIKFQYEDIQNINVLRNDMLNLCRHGNFNYLDPKWLRIFEKIKNIVEFDLFKSLIQQ